MPGAFPSPLERLVSRLASRSRLNAEERGEILALTASSVSIAAGTTLAHCGDAAGNVCLVAQGLVGSFHQTRAGARQIVALHIQGDMADLASMAEGEAGCGLKALSNATIIRVCHRELQGLIDTFPMIGKALWRDGVADARILAEWTFNIGSKPARARLAHLLCEMAFRYEQTGCDVGLCYELLMTQDHLAQATAMTPVHLNRTMMGLRQEGIVEMRNKIVAILDWKALMQAAEFSPRYLHFAPAAVQ